MKRGSEGKKMAKESQGLWRNVLRFLVKVSHIDLNEELLRENEYLKAEIDVYRKQLEQLGKRPRFTDGMRRRLVGKALVLGRRMRDVVTIVRPDTILRWQRRMVAALYDSSGSGRRGRGRPAIGEGIVEAVVRMAKENPAWGYDRIVGELGKNGIELSATSVAGILDKHGIHPVKKRGRGGMSWAEFLRLPTAIRAPFRAVSIGNLSQFGRKKSLSGHSRDARWTVIWVPDEYLHQTRHNVVVCMELYCVLL
ncbi:MAG: hypothetical protein IJS15_13060 [Victivallales bacterium]|nr:hypothetical protein [Victivallales bacterium]